MKRKRNGASPKLSTDAHRIISYWRDSLIEGEREEISARDLKALGIVIDSSEVIRGRTSNATFQTLQNKSRDHLSQKAPARRDAVRRSELMVLLAPLRLQKQNPSASGPQHIEAFWVPGLLDEQGRLLPPFRVEPWIPRSLLEPPTSAIGPTIGDVSDLEEFSRASDYREWQAWPEYFEHCSKLFRSVTGRAPEKFELEDYVAKDGCAILVDTSSQGIFRSHIQVLGEVLDGKQHPGLLPKLATVSEPKRRPYPNSRPSLRRAALKHSGHFGDRFALAPSQRSAVHRFFETRDDSILCVTGPPGTGKTTFLQSIVASLWVNAACNRAVPPIIVACGATNQSVTNILDSFGQAQSAKDLFAERWLPGIQSYGRFCCSETRSAEAGDYHLELRKGGGLSAAMDQRAYFDKATAYFLSCFHKASQQDQRRGSSSASKLSLKTVVDTLHKQLKKHQQALRADLSKIVGGNFGSNAIEDLKDAIGIPSRFKAERLFPKLEALDTARRNHLFLLATHYWEGRWLLETLDQLNRLERLHKGNSRLETDTAEWQRRAMVTPTFVSTLAMCPKFFTYSRELGRPPIDLLIFDEASQISSELGAVGASLAEQLVVVGDEKQLEPVYGVQPQADRANAMKHRLLNERDDDGWVRLARRGTLASNGSFMRLAIRSSSQIEQTPGRSSTIGVFLSEHRRSVPTLMAFCNELAYAGRLEPKRAELPKRILPAFGYVHVEGRSENAGPSRFNRQELERLVAWLTAHEKSLLEFYKLNDLSQVVAVLSPFTAQIARLRSALQHRYPSMTIGTVHSLQGAECPIVLFSTVYDRMNSVRYALDRDVNLLNVAVSRARDSFIVFSDTKIFDPAAPSASGVLAKYLFADKANEIG